MVGTWAVSTAQVFALIAMFRVHALWPDRIHLSEPPGVAPNTGDIPCEVILPSGAGEFCSRCSFIRVNRNLPVQERYFRIDRGKVARGVRFGE
jgi:hypothetical protein